MGVEHGYLYTCDRCLAEEFEPSYNDDRVNWTAIGVGTKTYMLCPACYGAYLQVMERFTKGDI